MKKALWLLTLSAGCGGTTPEAASFSLATPEADLGRQLAGGQASYVVVRAGTALFLGAEGDARFGETDDWTRLALLRAPEGGRVAVGVAPLAADEPVPGCGAPRDPMPDRPVRLALYVDVADLVPVVSSPFRARGAGGAEVRAAVGTPVRVEAGRVRFVDEGIEVELLARDVPRVGYAFACADEACAEVVVPDDRDVACEDGGAVDVRLSPLAHVHASSSQVVAWDGGGYAVTGPWGCFAATLVPAGVASFGACDLASASGEPTLSAYGADEAVGGDSMEAMGAMLGVTSDSSAGGLGLMGTGGGGGTGEGTYGMGTLGTLGHGGGGGIGADDGSGGRYGEPPRPPLHVRPAGVATVRGGLTADQIRRVVQRNMSQVTHCYEQALQLDPTVEGQVDIDFVIAANGAVASSAVAQLGPGLSPALGACIANAFRRWSFPQADPPGEVRVRFPLMLGTGSPTVTPVPEVGVRAGAPLATVDGVVVGEVLEAFRLIVPPEQVGTGRACFPVRVEGVATPDGFVPLCAPSDGGGSPSP